MATLMEALDHLVFAAPDLAAAVSAFEKATGVAPSPGGAHPNWGTRNALVSLGPNSYLEIIGPDPEQKDFKGARPFRIDELAAPALVTWAAKASPIQRVVDRAREMGYDAGPIHPGKRERPDGTLLAWSLTMPQFEEGDGLVPFLIDWGNSPHPSENAAKGCTLSGFWLNHGDAKAIEATLACIGINATVENAEGPFLSAQLDTPRGVVTLGAELRMVG